VWEVRDKSEAVLKAIERLKSLPEMITENGSLVANPKHVTAMEYLDSLVDLDPIR
jgi:hypothetical protein